MSTTRPEREQATEPIQSDQYQPLGRQEAPTKGGTLYGGTAGPTNPAAKVPAATDADGNAQTDEQTDGAIPGPGVSGGSSPL